MTVDERDCEEWNEKTQKIYHQNMKKKWCPSDIFGTPNTEPEEKLVNNISRKEIKHLVKRLRTILVEAELIEIKLNKYIDIKECDLFD